MYVSELRLFNWLCYRGEHRLTLAPIVYGVLAQRVDDADRSNWSGKTGLLNAVRFALYGKHPAAVEDDWITHDEPAGGCGLLLSDGTIVERRRERGKATRLAVQVPGQPKAFDGDAQRVLEERIGMADGDFTATCFFPQKQIDRFVTATPSQRMAVIAGWLQLEPLQRAEKAVRQSLNRLLDEDTRTEAALGAQHGTIRSLLSQYFELAPNDALSWVEADADMGEVVNDCRKAAAAAKAHADRLKAALVEYTEWRGAVAGAAAFDRIMAEVAALGDVEETARKRGAVVARLTAATKVADEAKDRCVVERKQYTEVEALARGRFGGKCPIDGHACPDVVAMNSAVEANTQALSRLRASGEASTNHLRIVNRPVDDARAELRAIDDAEARRVVLLESTAAHRPAKARIEAAGMPPDTSTQEQAADAAWETYQQAEGEAREAARVHELVRGAFVAVEHLQEQSRQTKRRVVIMQQAIAILGRNGAQRRIAEGALGNIATMANESLRETGIPLQVDITWAHEGQGLADECPECGAAYPKGRSVKQCGRCGSVRGPKTIDRIDVKLSNVSGAAEDLAGVAIQLAAGAWLRARRGSAWSAAFIDEPFGALDPSNRRALATHLAALLRGRYGFEQAAVVAHDRAITDSMPGRLLVTADVMGSHPAVV